MFILFGFATQVKITMRMKTKEKIEETIARRPK